jgi:hypothetical protein
MTAQEFHRAIKRDKTHYEDLTKDSSFSSWNRNFTATAHIHHTHLVLAENYVPKMTMKRLCFGRCRLSCMLSWQITVKQIK